MFTHLYAISRQLQFLKMVGRVPFEVSFDISAIDKTNQEVKAKLMNVKTIQGRKFLQQKRPLKNLVENDRRKEYSNKDGRLFSQKGKTQCHEGCCLATSSGFQGNFCRVVPQPRASQFRLFSLNSAELSDRLFYLENAKVTLQNVGQNLWEISLIMFFS